MGLIEEVAQLGADTNDAMARFMGNSDLYERMLKKFVKVVDESPVMSYAQAGDFEMAASNAHALKGVTGNLSLDPLYKYYTTIVDLYRAGDNEKATALLNEALDIQQKFIDVISKFI